MPDTITTRSAIGGKMLWERCRRNILPTDDHLIYVRRLRTIAGVKAPFERAAAGIGGTIDIVGV